MNVVGERILIFGDSLTHSNGGDDGPEIWDVDAGSGRSSSAPGDLLASILLEQGAAAVRTDANVGRSAHNFWAGTARHQHTSAADLIASDQAFAPTKVVVMLGTNDADSGAIDQAAMQQIADTYAAMGAEVWAIGPPVFAEPSLSAKADQVYTMMSNVFGDKLIDWRPLSSTDQRAGDGMHFQASGAAVTAPLLANALMTTSSASFTIAGHQIPWLGFGVLAGLFGILGFFLWRQGKGQALTGPKRTPTRSTFPRATVDMPSKHDPTAHATVHRTLYKQQHAYKLVDGPDAGMSFLAADADAVLDRLTGSGKTVLVHYSMYNTAARATGLKGPSGPTHYETPKEKLPAYFVDPETGEVIEVDQRAAKYRRDGEDEFRGLGMHMVDGKAWRRGHSPAAAGYKPIACKAGIPGLQCWVSR